jgi:hypothetical protein
MNLLFGDQLVLHVNRNLHVIAHAHLGHACHGPAVRVRERDLLLAGAVQFLQERPVALALAPDGRDLLGQPRALAARALAATRAILIGVASIQGLEIPGQLLVGLLNKRGQRSAPGEVAVLVVDRLDAGAVHRQSSRRTGRADGRAATKARNTGPEGGTVVAPEVGDGLEVGLQDSKKPDHLDVAVGLGFQPPARAHPVQVAVDVELQQVAGIVARRPVAFGTTRAKPAAARSSSSTKASMKRTGLSGPT